MARVGADGIFRRVKVRIWRSGSFSRLSRIEPSGQALWLYLLTCPESCAIPGVIVAGRAQLAEALGWPVEKFDQCYAEIAAERMAVVDWSARLLWLPRGPYENPPANPNIVKSWAPVFRTLPDCALKARIYSELHDFTKAFGKGFAEAFDEAFPKAFGKGLGKGFVPSGVPKGVGSREEGVETPPPVASQQSPPQKGGTAATDGGGPELPPEDEDLPPNAHPEAVPNPDANAHPWDPEDEHRFSSNQHWEDYVNVHMSKKIPAPWPAFTQWLAQDIKRRGALAAAGQKAIADREAQEPHGTAAGPRSPHA